jgi:hypothetical protein
MEVSAPRTQGKGLGGVRQGQDTCLRGEGQVESDLPLGVRSSKHLNACP